MAKLPTIREIITKEKHIYKGTVSDKVTDPIKDFIDEEIIGIIQNIKMNNYTDVDGVRYKNKETTHYFTQDEKVPINYRKRWTKEDLMKLYKGIVIHGLDLEYLVYWMDYKYTRRQLKYRIKQEEKIRPHMINAAMLRINPKK